MHSASTKDRLTASICWFGAALAHLGCLVFGGDWYRFFGAGEQMALMAARAWYPTIVTSVIVMVLLFWALYGLSGAGAIKRLPLTKLALILIASIFLIRGVSLSG